MYSSLQPSRPKTTSPSNPNPLFQQQTRVSHSASPATTGSTSAPRNQIEAMPPGKTPIEGNGRPQYNPAHVHPVFFSESWHRPPFPVPMNSGFSPIATGYVFRNGQVRPNGTKL